MNTLNPASALLTDLYQLTMLQVYFESLMNKTAVFEFFVRKLPPQRHFLIAAGLQQVVDYLGSLHFDDNELDWLRSNPQFHAPFIESLRQFRFTGDVDAMPEGTIFFPDEPVLRVTAPLAQAQFIESRVMNLLHYQTMVASKAARIRLAAGDKRLVDFGLRRAHGAEAALLSARASYLAGFHGSATTLAAPMFGIPVFGTMAHSFVLAHESETEAFIAFANAFPSDITLLIDTYDIEAGARLVARLARRLALKDNIFIQAVRIDSGDLNAQSRRVRQILDREGAADIRIVASGDLDEYSVQALMQNGVPIDGFGVGTRMNTSGDAPFLDCAWKLVEYDSRARRKRSPGKVSWPGRKQVSRHYDRDGLMCGDTLRLESNHGAGKALLQPIMRGGQLLAALPDLQQSRTYAAQELRTLPPGLLELKTSEYTRPYAVTVSEGVQELALQADQAQRKRAIRDMAGG